MSSLFLHGKPVETVFDLLGKSENAMTYSLGWCLAESPALIRILAEQIGSHLLLKEPIIDLQRIDTDHGITDIELRNASGDAAWIIEAKAGFAVPSEAQLKSYATRLRTQFSASQERGLVILAQSDRTDTALQSQAPDHVAGIPVITLSWRRLLVLVEMAYAESGLFAKKILSSYANYLKRIIDMQDQTSAWVYVVSLNRNTFEGGETTFVDVVEQHQRYFHPQGRTGGGWPIQPPNYLAFRYDGGLQSIHHVENVRLITDFGPYFPNQPSTKIKPHYLYDLGPAIRPPKWTPTGAKWRSNRVYCLLDTLLTADTIAEAKRETDRRLNAT